MKQIEWIKVIRDMSPRVHCITNYVTAGDVANMVLAIGGSPIMAQGIRGRTSPPSAKALC